jgi:outer membrane lipase/esterase
LTNEGQERLEEGREKQAGRSIGRSAGATAELGPISLFLNLASEKFDFDPTFDVDNESGYDGWKAGFQIGGDVPVSDKLIVGALVGFDHSEAALDPDIAGRNFTPSDSQGANRSDGLFINVYSSYNVTDNFYIEGTAGYGYTSYTFDRNAVFQETTRTTAQTNVSTSGDTHGNSISASVGMGYDVYSGAVSIGPYARINFSRSKIDGYTEEDRNSSGLNMTIQDDTSTSLTSVVGVQMSYAHSANWGVFVPQLRFEYEHEHRDDPRSIVTSFATDATGSSFAVVTDEPDKKYFNVGASMLFVLPNGWMPFLDAEMLLSYHNLDRQRYTFGLRKEL